MSHWYNMDCDPHHTTIGANGKERATTLRDAKKHGYFPSVSTILGLLDKPSLQNWKFRQITDACWGTPEDSHVCVDQDVYNKAMVKEAFDKVKDAQDVGTQIHAALEHFFSGQEFDLEEKVVLPNETVAMKTFIKSVEKKLDQEDVTINACELRLVSQHEGYAGTTDAAINRGVSRGILDFKTTKTKADTPVKPYPEQVMQLAAYHMAHYGDIRTTDTAVNVYISTTEPGRVESHWYSAKELVNAYFNGFIPLCKHWRYAKNYDPTLLTTK